MQIYLVVRNIDLGYHAVQGYTDSKDADQECQRLTQEYNDIHIKNLMDHCGYSQVDAEEYASHYDPYEVVTVGVE